MKLKAPFSLLAPLSGQEKHKRSVVSDHTISQSAFYRHTGLIGSCPPPNCVIDHQQFSFPSLLLQPFPMTRGNQRELDRARAAKRTDKRKPKESQADLTKRKERDAQIMRDKQAKATSSNQASSSNSTK
jgi:hypothetical protein